MAASRALRKFPFNLGIGTDICHVVRIRGILKSSRGQRFVQKILNINERAHPKIQWLLASRLEHGQAGALYMQRTLKAHTAEALRNPSQSQPGPDTESIEVAATFMAGRFAAKEAVIKAHPHRALTWHDITIQSQQQHHPDRKGAPVAIIRGETEDQEALISISHDGEYATAVCLGAGET